MSKIAGTIYLTVDGETQNCEGEFEYNLGTPKREALVGSDRYHGYKEEPQAAFVKGNLRRTKGFDIAAFQNKDGVDLQLRIATGETFVFADGFVGGEGTVNTGTALFAFEFYAEKGVQV